MNYANLLATKLWVNCAPALSLLPRVTVPSWASMTCRVSARSTPEPSRQRLRRVAQDIEQYLLDHIRVGSQFQAARSHPQGQGHAPFCPVI